MASFGKAPFRSLPSFGVAGLLQESCEIFHHALFSTTHLGRVSDLICARLKQAGHDELKLRALILFGVFEGHRAGKMGEKNPEAPPIFLECGVDGEALAIAIAFAKFPRGLEITKLADKISGVPDSEFEILLHQIYAHADQLVVRVSAKQNKIEIVALLALSSLPQGFKKPRPEVIDLDTSAAQATPKAKAYTELGDLNFPYLLRDDAAAPELGRGTAVSTPVGGKELEEALRKKARDEAERVTKISGVTQILKEEVIRIKGSPAETDNTRILISGKSGDLVNQDVLSVGLSEKDAFYQKRIDELKTRITELESAAVPVSATDPTEEFEGDGKGSKQKISRFLKNVWPFKREESEDDSDDDEGDGESSTGAETNVKLEEIPSAKRIATGKPDAVSPSEATVIPTIPSESDSNMIAEANSLMVEIQAGSLDRTINKAQKESSEIKKELTSTRAKRWMDGLMGELVAEKARLQEFAKKLNQNVRAKELDFRNKEQALKEELRRREEMLRQKNNALLRAKEQVSQMTVTLDRVKANPQTTVDETRFKQKYGLTQKILEATKKDNNALTIRVDELKSQLATAQIQATSTRTGGALELKTLQSKYDRLLKQTDEFKRANRDLADKATEKVGAVSSEEMKKRLDAAMRMATNTRRDADLLQLRVEELQREEQRLKSELERALGEVKAAKAKGNPPKAA